MFSASENPELYAKLIAKKAAALRTQALKQSPRDRRLMMSRAREARSLKAKKLR